MVFGLLNVDKPRGPTSHDVVAAVRRGSGERRVGHAGTLDPLAGGVLVLALGQATRLTEYLTASTKSYRAELLLGRSTDTYDAEGRVLAERPLPAGLDAGQIERVLDRFRGEIVQVPPVFSAVKVEGRSAHARARAGERVEMKPRRVVIEALTLLAFEPPLLRLAVDCSAGTYIRSLAHDVGEALGCGAMLSTLTRTASGSFRLEDSVKWDTLQASFADDTWRRFLLPPGLALPGTPEVWLDAQGLRDVCSGAFLAVPGVVAGLARAYGPDGELAAVLEGDPGLGVWRPKKVLAPGTG